jgi:ribosome-associated protein
MTKSKFSPLVDVVVDSMDDRKANGITVLDLREIDNAIADYFVICDGTSNTQVKAIADRIEEMTSKSLQEKPWHVEGTENAQWVLMDYVNTVVHIFQKEMREFYDLESLWGDGQVTVINGQD